MLMANPCKDCGYPLKGDEVTCPECGMRVQTDLSDNKDVHEMSIEPNNESKAVAETTNENKYCYKTVSELFWNCEFYMVFKGKKFDLAQRIYECFELWIECVKVWWNCVTNKFFVLDGRASRREYFSFIGFPTNLILLPNPLFILSLFFLIGFIPLLAVGVRRMHDINKSGWWLLCPIANIFFLLKKSDEGKNHYGNPNPYIL